MSSIWEQAEALKQEAVSRRRDVHRFPEPAWTEFRTTALIVEELQRLGFEVLFGADIIDGSTMMGVPDEATLQNAAERAVSEGADAELVCKMNGGRTGVVGILKTERPGKTAAFRFDIDCNDLQEAEDEQHFPCRDGFASVHSSAMHACGHDGHVAIGLLTARLLVDNKDKLSGTVKLIFQPAEEGVRGALAMVKAGVVDDVDFFFGGHIGFKATNNNTLAVLSKGFLATAKLDAEFFGKASHAGAAPEKGRNALLAAAQAAVSLNTIARHSGGASRINVGVMEAGTGRNVVPDYAILKLETRGADSSVNAYMLEETRRILKACADMYGVFLQERMMGSAPSCQPDEELSREVAALLAKECRYDELLAGVELGGSEDCSYFMERVQQRGGRALYLMYGSVIKSGHHSNHFDFDEDCLWRAAAALTTLAVYFTGKNFGGNA